MKSKEKNVMTGTLSLQIHSDGVFLFYASSVSNQKRAIRPGNTVHMGFREIK